MEWKKNMFVMKIVIIRDIINEFRITSQLSVGKALSPEYIKKIIEN